MTEAEHHRDTVSTWWPWIALVLGLVAIVIGGILFSP
jgi:hypothetical protein